MKSTVTINVHEAKARFSQISEQAHSGQEIILAKAGKPCARMMPLEVISSKRQPGGLKIKLDNSFFDPLPVSKIAARELSEKR